MAVIPPLYAHIKASIISWGGGSGNAERLCGNVGRIRRRGKNSANWQRKQTACIVQYPAARRQEHPSAVQNTVHGSLNIDTSILCSRAYREPRASRTVPLVLFLLSLWTKRYAKNKYIWKNRGARREASLPPRLLYYPPVSVSIIALQLYSFRGYPIGFNRFSHFQRYWEKEYWKMEGLSSSPFVLLQRSALTRYRALNSRKRDFN